MKDPLAPGLLQRLAEPPHKVAILKASRIGDFLCATPAMRSMRIALPQAEFTLITLPILKGLAERLPYIDHVVEFPGYPGIAEQFFRPENTARFFVDMQSQHFDLAVQFQGTGVFSNPFMLMLGACYTAGFIREEDPPGLLSAALPWPEKGHEIHRNLALARFIGAPGEDEKIDMPLHPGDLEEARRLLSGFNRPLIGLHPGARQPTRRWPLDRFIAVGRTLQLHTGGTIVLVGEREGWEAGEKALQEAGVAFLNLAGLTSVVTLGAVISQLNVFVTNDTGPAHIAYALGTPTIVIFGGGDPSRYGPRLPGPFRIIEHPVLCRPCAYFECPIGYKCLNEVSVEEVLDAAKKMLDRRRMKDAFFIHPLLSLWRNYH